ncbi:hypothetical protein ACJJTC_014945 [Scirpophaga incertulas]
MPRKWMCCVGNCHYLRQDAILYKIPDNKKRLNKWLKCLGHVCDVENLVPGVSMVCSTHFEARFITASTSRLSAEVYPSLFTNAEISSGTPSLEYTHGTMTIGAVNLHIIYDPSHLIKRFEE